MEQITPETRDNIRAAAENVQGQCTYKTTHARMAFNRIVNPDTVIALLDENEALRLGQKALDVGRKEAKVCCFALQAENTRLREALGMDKPEPVTTTLDILADAADILMGTNYDAHGYEVICHARDNARKHIKTINQALTQKGGKTE